MDEATGPAAYRIHVWIRGINPMIWRRLVVPSERTLADLHYAIQIAFGWTDYHLHRFRIRGKEYSIPRRGGPWYSRDARDLRLSAFHFRVNERFLYEYDFTDGWEHQVRIEQFVPPEQTQPYSVCVGGSRAAPPEDCGGPVLFSSGETRPHGKHASCWTRLPSVWLSARWRLCATVSTSSPH